MSGEERFDWVTFEKDEHVVWSSKPHRSSVLPEVVLGVLLLPVLGVGLALIVVAYLRLKNTDYVVTNRGVYVKKGYLSRSVTKAGFEKIQNISFRQGVLGSYFGYGTVEISTAGGEGVEMEFESVEDPKDVQELITKRIESRGRAGRDTDNCPVCGSSVEDDWLACANCGELVRDSCDDCGELVETTWDYCPYCSSYLV